MASSNIAAMARRTIVANPKRGNDAHGREDRGSERDERHRRHRDPGPTDDSLGDDIDDDPGTPQKGDRSRAVAADGIDLLVRLARITHSPPPHRPVQGTPEHGS
jgi:hypothetical protein